MVKYTYATIFILAGFWVSAQTLSPSVIASTGGFSSNSNGSLSYTVGEMTMVQTFSAGNNILTQGFQQPNDVVIGLLEINSGEYGNLVVYPNPAVDNFSYGFELPAAGKVYFRVFDQLGQIVADGYNGSYTGGKEVHEMNVTPWAAGTYYLQMTFTDVSGSTHYLSKQFQVIN
ncbi:MAG: T9SS type A sorting domain-containing protein [Chitinophagales bacterium]